MKEFLTIVGEFLQTYPQIRLNTSDKKLISDSVLNHFSFENMGQLRDRFEGQAFLDKTTMKVGSVIAINKNFDFPAIDFDKLFLRDFQPQITLREECVDVHVFEFGTLPLLEIEKIDKPIFFVIKKDSITFSLCGLASIDVVKNNLVESSLDRSNSNSHMNFTGFKYLEGVKSIIKNK